MKTLTLPSVLAFNRKLEPSDGIMSSGNWSDIADRSNWQPIKLFERRNRAVKSNFTQEVLDNEQELQKQMAEANLSWGDDAAILHGQDTLCLGFSLRIVSDLQSPNVCNKVDFESRFNTVVDDYVKNDIMALAQRYAYNIANGRFLWRNRLGAEQLMVRVSGKCLPEIVFDAYDYSLNETQSTCKKVEQLASVIAKGLQGDLMTVLKIEAFAQLGDAQKVWPSQEMVLNSAKGEKSRHLFEINGVAAMHCEKIGNALRTIDDWYPDYATTNKPIAIEAYGSVTQRGVAYRSTKNDFKSLLLKWLNDGAKKLSDEEKHFVVAMVIRGGVFGEGES
jgi:CRISPR-associated protein Csy3